MEEIHNKKFSISNSSIQQSDNPNSHTSFSLDTFKIQENILNSEVQMCKRLRLSPQSTLKIKGHQRNALQCNDLLIAYDSPTKKKSIRNNLEQKKTINSISGKQKYLSDSIFFHHYINDKLKPSRTRNPNLKTVQCPSQISPTSCMSFNLMNQQSQNQMETMINRSQLKEESNVYDRLYKPSGLISIQYSDKHSYSLSNITLSRKLQPTVRAKVYSDTPTSPIQFSQIIGTEEIKKIKRLQNLDDTQIYAVSYQNTSNAIKITDELILESNSVLSSSCQIKEEKDSVHSLLHSFINSKVEFDKNRDSNYENQNIIEVNQREENDKEMLGNSELGCKNYQNKETMTFLPNEGNNRVVGRCITNLRDDYKLKGELKEDLTKCKKIFNKENMRI